MVSIATRTKKDGFKSYMVRWRDPKTRASQGLSVATLTEAETLKRLLDANGQSFEIAQHAILTNEKRVPTQCALQPWPLDVAHGCCRVHL